MNILKNRLDSIKTNRKENIFKHRMTKMIRKGSKIINVEPYPFQSFCFNGNLHSNFIEKEKFTNFIKSYDNILNQILKDIFDKLYKDDYSFLDEFVLDEYQASEYTSESKRLKRIIAEVNNIDEKKLPRIDKFKPAKCKMREDKRYDGIRFYVSCNEDGIIDLYLIDLYHMAIDAYNYKTGRYDLERNYENLKSFNKCISKIADDYII